MALRSFGAKRSHIPDVAVVWVCMRFLVAPVVRMVCNGSVSVCRTRLGSGLLQGTAGVGAVLSLRLLCSLWLVGLSLTIGCVADVSRPLQLCLMGFAIMVFLPSRLNLARSLLCSRESQPGLVSVAPSWVFHRVRPGFPTAVVSGSHVSPARFWCGSVRFNASPRSVHLSCPPHLCCHDDCLRYRLQQFRNHSFRIRPE